MKKLIKLTLSLILISLTLSSCTTSNKAGKKSVKRINTSIFNYKDAGIKSLSCNAVTDLMTKAAQIGRAAHILSNEEVLSLARLKIEVELNSVNPEKLKITFPELRPFSNELAKTKLGPFVDASIKIIESDFLVINTLLALPALDENSFETIISETKDLYVLKASSKNYKSITFYKDSSKLILEPTDSKEGVRTIVSSSKAANSDFYLVRSSQGSNLDKDIKYNYTFAYELQNNTPVPSTVKIIKKDFDIALNYGYTFKECTIKK